MRRALCLGASRWSALLLVQKGLRSPRDDYSAPATLLVVKQNRNISHLVESITSKNEVLFMVYEALFYKTVLYILKDSLILLADIAKTFPQVSAWPRLKSVIIGGEWKAEHPRKRIGCALPSHV